MDHKNFAIRCGGHTYVSLYYGDEFIHCYDNDMEYMETIIEKIEKRTRMKFETIPIIGEREDFNGLRFLYGYERDWIKNPIKEGQNG